MKTKAQAPQKILLLSDSQLLFRDDIMARLLPAERNHLKAAYIGVSSDDEPVFYEIFRGTMQNLGIDHLKHIHTLFPDEEREFLQQADLILLGGGDTQRGWQILRQSGMNEILAKRYYDGSVMIGVSAGAVQLGLFASTGDGADNEMLKLIPLVIDVHDEQNDWHALQELLTRKGPYMTGVGIPLGGGLLYHPEPALEAVAQPIYEFRFSGSQLKRQLLFPNKQEAHSG